MKIMLIGPSAAGKTTLIQRLIDKEIKYDKTQTVEYVGDFIDTPGEYMQQRGYWGSLTITSHDADIIGLVQDSTSEDCWFSGGLTSKFQKPVVGILTKIDREDSNQKQGRSYLELAGCTKIFPVSSYTGEGVEELFASLHQMIEQYKEDNARRYADDYFD
ncbi:MAG: EutP/PduV family microcompartment system protein [Eubacteriales bacterium]|nr:EutP/PduV family microcompartment system protein [Eubacteriales bacterium]